jgi:hypothetical protein
MIPWVVIAIFQLGVAATGPASWHVGRMEIALFDAPAHNASLASKAALSVDIFEEPHYHDPLYYQCSVEIPSPITQGRWGKCGNFQVRARGISGTTDVEFYLDVVRLNSKMCGGSCYPDPKLTLFKLDRDKNRAPTFKAAPEIDVETGTVKFATNWLTCKTREQDMARICSTQHFRSQDSPVIKYTSEHTTYKFIPPSIRNLITKGSLRLGESAPIPPLAFLSFAWLQSGYQGHFRGVGGFEFQAEHHNLINDSVLPGFLSSIDRERLTQTAANTSCKGNWKNDEVVMKKRNETPFPLDTHCQNNFGDENATYVLSSDGRARLMLPMKSRVFIGVGDVEFMWRAEQELAPANGTVTWNPKRHCDGEVCTWETFEVPLNGIAWHNYTLYRDRVFN